MTCYGAATYPISEKEYMNSKQMWMWRAYNGALYSQGTQLDNKIEKIHSGDLVRFDLDCNTHVIKIYLNDKEMGESFKQVNGTIYPAVAFYGSDRSIELISVEKIDKNTTDPLLYLTSQKLVNVYQFIIYQSSVGYGSIGLNNGLGYDNLKAKVNNENIKKYISIHPPSNGCSYATFSFKEDLYCRFITEVAISDEVKDETNPLTFRVKTGNELLWESKKINKSKIVEKCDIQLPDKITELTLEIFCDGKNENCHGIFISPLLYSKKLPNNMKLYLSYLENKPKDTYELAKYLLKLIENQSKCHISSMSSLYKIDPFKYGI